MPYYLKKKVVEVMKEYNKTADITFKKDKLRRKVAVTLSICPYFLLNKLKKHHDD